ncbi:uncharacterized protein LOC131431670 isoform X2 [Malaya genurostris]|uniref:uncharacterized protein LOC131431670 isoform X2 n=1 Tax=Malaya genurostris TaxID=325434 RepID=UPI0026F382A1|nr:uncharacterized protein LOC131431670 isoform X2 [Malaya genurostris]
MVHLAILMISVCAAEFILGAAGASATVPSPQLAATPNGMERINIERPKRTIGSSMDFISCLVVGETQQRFCSYDHALLRAVEQAATAGITANDRWRPNCSKGQIFRNRCNICECRANGTLACTVDLCVEDFYDAKGLPKYW